MFTLGHHHRALPNRRHAALPFRGQIALPVTNFFAIADGVGVLDGHGTGVYNAGSSNDWPPSPGTGPPPPPSQCPG